MYTQPFNVNPLIFPWKERSLMIFRLMCAFLLLDWSSSVLAETEPPLRELPRATFRTTPAIFKEWKFETDANTFPKGFTAYTVGKTTKENWTIRPLPGAPSGAQGVVQTANCPDMSCVHVLLADDVDLQYVDLGARIKKQSDTPGSAGLVFAAKDARNFYGVLFDPQAKLMQAIQVIDGKLSVLETQEFEPEDVDWHFLRIQRRTLVSKDFANIHLDHHRILSVSGSELQSGKVGFITSGQATYAFDNLSAMEILTGRPLSRPPAY